MAEERSITDESAANSSVPEDSAVDNDDLEPGQLVKRHRVSTRIWHWTNALAIIVLFMSGLSIFNAHPRLYWGSYGANNDAAWLQIGGEGERGYLQIGDTQITTTGVLGRWNNGEGGTGTRAFPWWSTIPGFYSLATGRLWHFFFAWILALGWLYYAVWSFISRHVQRDLAPTRNELKPRAIWHDIKEHARFRFPEGAAALSYNFLQKMSYLMVIFILIPLVILTGLTMSPTMDAIWPWLLDVFGGRQSARSIHFICAFLLLGFFFIHILLVILVGPINETRSMITGWFRLPGTVEETKIEPQSVPAEEAS